MKQSIVIVLTILISTIQILAKPTEVKTTGEAQIEWLDHMSKNDAQKKAEELATIDALERAFGRVVVQGNSTYMSNRQTGDKVETNTTFNMIANTSVKGEVVKILGTNFEEIQSKKIIDNKMVLGKEIKCTIEILAREIITPPVEFEANTLSCTNKGCKTEFFKNDQDFYIHFNSPISGFLTIFLDDQSDAYRLLPYKTMPKDYESAVPVNADQDYILFSSENNPFPSTLVDEYQLTTENIEELNRIFVIFSTEPVKKPKLSDDSEAIELPLTLSSEDFQRWLNKSRAYFKDKMQVKIIDIKIQK